MLYAQSTDRQIDRENPNCYKQIKKERKNKNSINTKRKEKYNSMVILAEHKLINEWQNAKIWMRLSLESHRL